MKFKLIIFLILFLPLQIFAQFNIEGIVVDEKNETLIGVGIRIKNSSKSTITDKDGKFRLNNVSTSDVIISTMIGFKIQETTIAEKNLIRIVMEEDIQYLNEVVAIGYGNVRRKDITGSVSDANMAEIEKAIVPSLDQALTGRIAGVQVTSADAQPGADMNIVIRGANSISQDNSPLYIVDGFPLENFSMASLNSSDIESFTVLKDASATAIYGARGANGVIVIETKKGNIGKPVVIYNGSYGFQQVTKKMDLMKPYEYIKYQIERDPTYMTPRFFTIPNLTLDDYKTMPNINWQDYLFRTAPMYLSNISVSGGANRTKYSFFGGFANQDGVIINTGFNNYQARINIEQGITDKLKVNVGMNYTYTHSHGQVSSDQGNSFGYSSFQMFQTWGYQPVGVGVGDIFGDVYNSTNDYGADSNVMLQPIIATNNEYKQKRMSNLFNNLTVDYQITKNLSLKVRGGLFNLAVRDEEFNNSKTYKGYSSPFNSRGVNAYVSDFQRKTWLNENLLTYRKAFRKNQLDVTGGYTIQEVKTSAYGQYVVNLPYEEMGISGMKYGIPFVSTALPLKNRLSSFLARANYNALSKYLFTLSFRADGSSKLSKDNRWGFFPSGAFAWVISEEDFMKNIQSISHAKIRMSYGSTGNNRIPDYGRYGTVILNDFYAFNGGKPEHALSIENLENAHLRWERTDQLDFGLDLSLFNNKINMSIDAYNKITNDLLLNAPLPYSSGLINSYKNVGQIRNRGLEFTINTLNIKRRGFEWTTNFNIAFNRSKVMKLSDGEDRLLSTIDWTGEWNATPLYITQVGKPISLFYGYVWDGNYQYSDFDLQSDGKTWILKDNIASNGTARENIQPGDIKYADQNNDGIVNEKDRVVIGNPYPIHTGGLSNNFSYKRFSLNVFFQWSYGNDVFNANRIMFEGNEGNRFINQFVTYENRWTPENQNNDYYRLKGGGPRGRYSSRTLEDGSYLRLKTVQIAYKIPQSLLKKIAVSECELSLAGQNLYTWSAYSGLDPEVSIRNTTLTPGFDYSSYARNRTISLGCKIIL